MPFTPEYTAGLMDGEGTITVKRVNRRLSNGDASCDLPVSVKLSNTNPLLVMPLKDQWGGSVYCPKKQKEHHRQIFVWEIGAAPAIKFLSAITPHLVAKKEQAIIVRHMAMANALPFLKPGTGAATRKPEWKLFLEQIGESRIRQLNFRANCKNGRPNVSMLMGGS